MKLLYALIIVLSLPTCGLSNENTQSELNREQGIVFRIGKTLVKVTHRDVEEDEQCPVIDILSDDRLKNLVFQKLCEIKIPGYRQFHALKDFAFIEYSNYRLQSSSTILYDIDLAILKGSAFEVTCRAEVKNKTISIGECFKIE